MRTALVILCLLLSALALGKDYTVFDVVGNSISAGVNPDYPSQPTDKGWVHMLFGAFGAYDTIDDLRPGIVRYNSAVSGSRASQWARNDYAPMQAVLSHGPDLVVVYIGGNDFLAYAADGEVTLQERNEYRRNLETIIDRLQANSPRPDVLLVNYYDLFDSCSANLPVWFAAYRVLSQATVDGNAIIAEVAAAKGCYLVDEVYNDFLHHAYGGDFGDPNHQLPNYVAMPFSSNFDIHPVTAGHEVIYHNVYSMLEALAALAPTPSPTPAPTSTSTPTPPSGQTPSPTPTPTGEPIRDLIRSFYDIVLARAPEPGAVDAWHRGYFDYAVSFNIDVRFIPREMARLFFLCEEYANRSRADAEFIADCYQVFLDRDPNQVELDNWTSGVWSRPQVMTVFSESAELANRIQAMYPQYGGNPTRNFVTFMYIGLLDRLVDRNGLEYAAALFDFARISGGAEAVRAQAKQMAREVIVSEEFLSKNPATDVYVTRFYRAFLGRFPNDAEVSYWSGELDSGRQTTDGLIELFAASQEFTARLGLYFGAP